MKTQTAVEWIVNELRQLAFSKEQHLGMGDIRITQGHIDELEEQAKQMELAQRIEDYNNGHADREKNVFRLPTKNSNESI
jgi:hypothetical protein